MARKLAVIPELLRRLQDLRIDLRDRAFRREQPEEERSGSGHVPPPRHAAADRRAASASSRCVPTPARSARCGGPGRSWSSDKSSCISCMKCVEACPFGAIYAHGDLDYPLKCDLCGGRPQCVEKCPKGALRLHSRAVVGRIQAAEQHPQSHPHEGNRVHREGRAADDPLRRDRQGGAVMTVKSGYFKKSLHVDLTAACCERRPLSDEFLAGTSADCGFGAKLVWDHLVAARFQDRSAGAGELLVIAPGPLTAPSAVVGEVLVRGDIACDGRLRRFVDRRHLGNGNPPGGDRPVERHRPGSATLDPIHRRGRNEHPRNARTGQQVVLEAEGMIKEHSAPMT